MGLRALLNNKIFDNFLELTLCRTVGRKTGLTVYRMGDWRILIDHIAGDQNGTKACLVAPMYQDFLAQLKLGGKPTILDVGGNGGGFVLMCARLLGELGTTVSLEFNPDTYRRLWYNLKANISNDIVVLNGAAAAVDGKMRVADRKGSTSDKPEAVGEEGRSVELDTITFDTLVEKYFGDEPVDLCKIDIEGSEFDFLLDGPASRLGQVRNLIIEIHPVEGRKTEDIENLLEDQGFRMVATADPVEGDVRLYVRGTGG